MSYENSRVWGWHWSTPLDNQDKEGLHCKGKRNGCTLTTFFLSQVITGLHKEGSQGLWFFSGKTVQSRHLAPLALCVISWEFVTSHSSLSLKIQWENSAWFDHSRSDCDGKGVCSDFGKLSSFLQWRPRRDPARCLTHFQSQSSDPVWLGNMAYSSAWLKTPNDKPCQPWELLCHSA